MNEKKCGEQQIALATLVWILVNNVIQTRSDPKLVKEINKQFPYNINKKISGKCEVLVLGECGWH